MNSHQVVKFGRQSHNLHLQGFSFTLTPEYIKLVLFQFTICQVYLFINAQETTESNL